MTAVWAVVDAAPDGIIVADEAGQILLANRQIEALFGYERGDLWVVRSTTCCPSHYARCIGHTAHAIAPSRASERWARA